MSVRPATLACIGIAIIAAACGGGGADLTSEERLELDAYFAGVDTLISGVADEIRSIDDAPGAAPLPTDAALQEQAAYLSAGYAWWSNLFGDFSEDLAALDPPPAAEDAHARLLETIVATAGANEGASQQDLESQEGLGAAFALIQEVAGSPGAACRELQAIADDNDVSLTLNCAFE